MDWAIVVTFMEPNVVPAKCLPTLKVNVLKLTPSMASPPNPSISLEPNSVMPPQMGRDSGHRIGVNKTPVGEQDYLHSLGQSVGGLIEHLPILTESNGGTAVFEYPPNHGQCPTSVDNR
jgi:hypothetical protein